MILHYNRDPLGESGFEVRRDNRPSTFGGGANLYLFVANDPINERDAFGLDITLDPAYKEMFKSASECLKELKKKGKLPCGSVYSPTRSVCECVSNNRKDIDEMAKCLCNLIMMDIKQTEQCKKALKETLPDLPKPK